MKGWVLDQIPKIGNLEREFHLATNLSIPEPTDGQVLVETLISPIHIDDIHLAEGSFFGGFPFILPSVSSEKPFVLGSDVTGVVKKIGKNVKQLKEGDIIWGVIPPFRERQGAWAEFCCVHEDYTLKKPETMSINAFAASCFSLFIACGAIERIECRLKNETMTRRKRVLIVGVSGGIGSIICQVLKQQENVYVIGVCSGKNACLVKEKHGVDEVIDYKKNDFQDVLADDELKVDAVIDCVGGTEVEAGGYKVLKTGGTFVTLTGPVAWIGDTELSKLELASVVFGMVWRSFRNLWSTKAYHISNPSCKTIHAMKNLLEKTTIEPDISCIIPFEDKDKIVQAIAAVRSHKRIGKVLIEISSK